jgi:heat shock protein HslJ
MLAISAFAAVTLLAACGSSASSSRKLPPAGSPSSSTPPTAGSIPKKTDLVGRWVPYPVRKYDAQTPFATFAGDGSWTGSDGCNGQGGTWTLGPDGAFHTVDGPSTLIGCDGAPIGVWIAQTAKVRLQGSVLELLDVAGQPLAKLTKV